MSEANIIDEIYDTSDLSLENSDINEDSEEIENLIYNLTETDIMGLYKNYSYKMENNDISNNNINNSKLDSITDKYLQNKEQISEVKYNIFMRMWNSCKPKEEVYKAIIRNYDKTFYLRRLVAQDFCVIDNKVEKKLCFKEKKYSFIPIDEDSSKNCLFHIGEDSLDIEFLNKIITNLKINGNQIKGMTQSEFEKKNKVEIPRKRKKKKNITQSSGKHQHISQVSKALSDKNPQTDPLNDIQYNASCVPSNESYGEEFSGSSLYVNRGSNNFSRYFFLSDYTKEIDGIYPIHNGIELNIGKVEFPDLSKEITEYNCKNDLKGQIFYKNFDAEKIMANEPIILEIKSSFSLYDIMNQIKQNIKIISNTSKDSVNIVLPKFIIGILCDYNFKSAEREKNKLNVLYNKDNNNDTEKTELQHILDIINKSKINVVICFVKKEIKGYNLAEEDYNIPGENLKYRVDLKYMYKKIFDKEIDETLLKKFQEEIEYESIRFEKKYNLNFNYEEYSKLSSFGENPENVKKKIVILKENYDEEKKQRLTLQENYEEEKKQRLTLQENYEEEKKQRLTLHENYEEEKKQKLKFQKYYEEEKKQNEQSKQKIEELEKVIIKLKKQKNQSGQIQQKNNQKENNKTDNNLSEKKIEKQSGQEQNQQIKNKQEQESRLQLDNS